MARSLAPAFLCLLGVVSCTSSVAGKEDELKLPELVQRFVAEFGKINAIAIAKHPDSSYAVALCDELNLVSVTYGKGNTWRRVTVDVAYPNMVTLKFADLDGDGKSELLVGSEQLEIYRIDKEKLSLIWASEKLFSDIPPPRIDLADLDGDSVGEIIVLNYLEQKQEGSSVYVWKQDAKDKLTYKSVSDLKLTDRHEYHSTSGLAVGDFVGNGKSQIAVANDNGILWLLALNAGELKVIGESEIPQGGAIGTALKTANMDDDVANELLVGSNGGEIYVVNISKDAKVQWSEPTATGRLAYGVNASDLNGDGIDEFILGRGVIGYSGMTQKDVVLQVFQYKDGVLKESWKQETIDVPRVLMHDLDGDGVDDVIAFPAYGSGDEVQVFRPKLKK